MSDASAVVTSLFQGTDPRCQALTDALHACVHERGAGLPFPLILGCLRILEHHLVQEQSV